MNYLQESSHEDWLVFAECLAKVHKTTNDDFGLNHDNYIGSIPQVNSKKETWADFFVECRLNPMLKRSVDLGLLNKNDIRSFERFYNEIGSLFPKEAPALLHGDLWSGNRFFSINGPVLIDPAVYFGHRDMDIAMSKLFGGFPNEFYEQYNEFHPLAKGWMERVQFCNLYPLLVHTVLFGSSYVGSVRRIIDRF